MLYNEEWIISQLKKHQETLDYLSSLVGRITVVLATSKQVYSNDGNPNTLGIVPDNPSLAALYADRLSGIIYSWNVNTAIWE